MNDKLNVVANDIQSVHMDAFYRCVLLPLLGMKPPQQSLYLLVDSVDEGCNITEGEQTSTSLSGTVAELLAGHHEFFPPWLLLLCSARKQSKAVTKMFTGKCNYCHVCILMCYWYISKLAVLSSKLFLAFLCKCHIGLIFLFFFVHLLPSPLCHQYYYSELI